LCLSNTIIQSLDKYVTYIDEYHLEVGTTNPGEVLEWMNRLEDWLRKIDSVNELFIKMSANFMRHFFCGKIVLNLRSAAAIALCYNVVMDNYTLKGF
jgi:hypothetical protein